MRKEEIEGLECLIKDKERQIKVCKKSQCSRWFDSRWFGLTAPSLELKSLINDVRWLRIALDKYYERH